MHTTQDEFKNGTITGHYIVDLCLRKLDQGNRIIILTTWFSGSSVLRYFLQHKFNWFAERFRSSVFVTD